MAKPEIEALTGWKRRPALRWV